MLKLKDLKDRYRAVAIYETDMEFQGIKFIFENSDKIAEEIKKHVESQGCTDFKREGQTCYFGNQSFSLPRIPARREGIVEFRSKDFMFSCSEWNDNRPSYGKKPKADMLTEDGFLFESSQGMFRYILGERK